MTGLQAGWAEGATPFDHAECDELNEDHSPRKQFFHILGPSDAPVAHIGLGPVVTYGRSTAIGTFFKSVRIRAARRARTPQTSGHDLEILFKRIRKTSRSGPTCHPDVACCEVEPSGRGHAGEREEPSLLLSVPPRATDHRRRVRFLAQTMRRRRNRASCCPERGGRLVQGSAMCEDRLPRTVARGLTASSALLTIHGPTRGVARLFFS